jgi:predicted RNA-binding protein with PUA-like domain
MAYWLMKSEPASFSIDDLAARPKQTEPWDGVRNYQARNFIRDRMRVGERAFFYHSSCAQPGIVGIVRIVSPAYPDPTQFDARHPHYDPASRREPPRWFAVDVQLERKLRRPLTLAELRNHEKRLRGLRLLAPGNRLSVMPVSPEHWDYLLALEAA